MAQSAQRTLKKVVDLHVMRSITSDRLLSMSRDEYHEVRRAATRARIDRSPRYVCAQCGHATYAPREGRTGQPYWKHHLGAPEDCPWWTGTPSRVDDVNARQFQGVQESPLHAAIKNTIGELLRDDVRTDAGSVVVDEYLIAEDGRRRPDVRAIHNGFPTVIEVRKNIEAKFRVPWQAVSMDWFPELCLFLQGRIGRTRIAKANASKGHRSFSTFEEFLAETTHPN